jgi:hypothetical protein
VTKYYWGDKIKEDEVESVCVCVEGMVREEKCMQGVSG